VGRHRPDCSPANPPQTGKQRPLNQVNQVNHFNCFSHFRHFNNTMHIAIPAQAATRQNNAHRKFLAAVTASAWMSALALLGGCALMLPDWTKLPPATTQEAFGAALVAEPIQMVRGYKHETQWFQVKKPQERWTVSLGMIDQYRPESPALAERRQGAYCFNWMNTTDPSDPCYRFEGDLVYKWTLETESGEKKISKTCDLDKRRTGSIGSKLTDIIGCSGFYDLPPGKYRILVEIITPSENVAKFRPHIIAYPPFFKNTY
jgi:hypothetical protein